MNRLTTVAVLIALLPCLHSQSIGQRQPASRLGPQLSSSRLAVRATVVDGIATTRVSQIIHNHGTRNAEATWILPLPKGAVADGFTMKVGDTVMTGDVLDSAGARQVYERIVRQQRDPGLLEYFGSGCLRARVFPIPPKQDVEVEVTYRQVLPETQGIYAWQFPLDAAGIPALRPELITLDVTLESQKPIRNVYSPTAGIDIRQNDDHRARISLETKTPPHGGLQLYYGLSEKAFGLNLMTWRKAGEKGYFMLMISPKRQWAEEEIMAKSVSFVLDTSGSMLGEKMTQAKKALGFFLRSLRPRDTFNITTFSTEAEPFFEAPLLASEENLQRALAKCETITASGGTNIGDALKRGITQNPDDGRVPLTVFLTDGQATVGTMQTETLLQTAAKANRSSSRIFVFGVGDEVNTHLLDRIAADSGGTRNYVREGEDIEVKTGDLFTKLSHPVMTNLELHLDGVEASKLVPRKLPHLFRGSQLTVFGRYTGKGAHAIRLCGTVAGTTREYKYAAHFAEASTRHDFVPSLWAERRTGILLDAMRLNGPNQELIGEVKRLGKAFNIVTPYTSHLILEEGLGVQFATQTQSTRRPPIRYRGPGDITPPAVLGCGPTGPRGPSGLGPTGPSAGGPSGPSTPGPIARAGAARLSPSRVAAKPALSTLVQSLRKAGILPRDASKAELERLALEVSRELQKSQAKLAKLSKTKTGRAAVDDSAYLAQFTKGAATSGSAARLLRLFVRRVKQHSFVLRLGVWTDTAFDAKQAKRDAWPRIEVTAYSSAYFDLLRDTAELRPYFAFSDRMLVVLDKKIYLVKAEAKAQKPVK